MDKIFFIIHQIEVYALIFFGGEGLSCSKLWKVAQWSYKNTGKGWKPWELPMLCWWSYKNTRKGYKPWELPMLCWCYVDIECKDTLKMKKKSHLTLNCWLERRSRPTCLNSSRSTWSSPFMSKCSMICFASAWSEITPFYIGFNFRKLGAEK